jgi:hypothetical protein
MRIFKYLAACAAIAVLFFVAAKPAQAQEPHYLRALSDLRTARDYIQSDKRGIYGSERHHATDAIDSAIAEIKHAAWDDGKSTRFAPPSGMTDAWFPLREAMKALAAAHHDVEQGVDTPQNTGLRSRALQHIEEAETIIHNVIQANHP